MTLLERLDERWERMDGAAATKIDRILKERREAAVEIKRLRAVLQDISEAPCSMVNDSESIRFSFNQVSAQARRAIAPTN